jgi:hypothetical protein
MVANSRRNTAVIVDLIRTFMAQQQSATTNEIIAHVMANGYARYSYKSALDKLENAGELRVKTVILKSVGISRYTATTLLGKTTIRVGKGSGIAGFIFEQPTPEGVLLLQNLVTGIEVQPCN